MIEKETKQNKIKEQAMTNTALMTRTTNDYTPSLNLNPFFEITRTPLFSTFNGQQVSVARDALFSPNGDLMGIVSPRYKVVTNQQVVELFDEFFTGLSVLKVQDHVSTSGAKWIREYVLNDDQYTVTIGDKKEEIKTKVQIHNGYDGKTGVGVNIAAWRKICSNGMMGWKKLIGTNFSHFSAGILDLLKSAIDTGFTSMQDNFVTWEKWSKEPYTEKQFMGFVDNRDYLSDKQKEATKNLYIPVMNRFGENETKWGAYNVITAIATHYTASRDKKVSNVFSSAYKTIGKVAGDFYTENKAS